MKIISWSNPTYFRFLVALVRSIRETGNKQAIHLALIDFEQKEHWPSKAFQDDNCITWEFLRSVDETTSVTNKREYYRNFRPKFFLKHLLKSKEPILTFGANGLVRRSLDGLNEDLLNNDMIFLERCQLAGNIEKYPNETICGIEELEARLAELNTNFDKVIYTPTCRVVLLGTHGFSFSDNSIEILKRWDSILSDSRYLNKEFSDMDLFVKVYIDMMRDGFQLRKRTYTEYKKEWHPICDYTFSNGGIWFAKGPSKWNNTTYLKEVNRLVPEKFQEWHQNE